MEPIEWRRDLEDSPTGRWFAYVLLGSATGLCLLGAVLIIALLPALVLSVQADSGILALAIVLALVGGPFSLVYLWPVLTDPAQRRPILANTWLAELPLVGVVVATVTGALTHLVAFLLFPFAPFLVLAVGALVGSTGSWLLLTEGRIDPVERTLRYRSSQTNRESRGRTVALDIWTDLASYRLGTVTILRPSYAPGSPGPRPRLLSIPTAVHRTAAPVFEDAIDARTPERGRPPNPIVAATLALFGVGTVGVGVAVVLLEVGPTGYRLYMLGLCGVFGGLFLVAAWNER